MRTNHKDPSKAKQINHSNESQVAKLKEWLSTGLDIDRVTAFKQLGIADLRSRVSNVESDMQTKLYRERVKGKKYLRYSLFKFASA